MTRTIPILTLSLGLLAAVAAQAEHRERYSPIQKLRYLADEVAKDARHVHREAERRAHHRSYREERVLRLLHDVDERARHFALQARRGGDLYHLRGDLVALERSFDRAAHFLPALHATRHVRRDFDELAESMYALSDFSDTYLYPRRSRWERHRRYEDRRGRVRVAWPRWYVDLEMPW